jgi:predicted enzyme related to lactoylglutathione lyase
MSQEKAAIGTVGWFDLTIEKAEDIRDFYQSVVGWNSSSLSMGEYDDFVMSAPEAGTPVAGVCHARGGNTGLPPQWLMYVNVANVDDSAAKCAELGGELITPIKNMSGHGRYCVIKDPAGAVIALFEQE